MFVGHKTHSVVFSLVAATPLLAIAYHQKTTDFMAQYGLSDFCIDEEEITEQRLVEIFDRMQPQLEDISQKQMKHSQERCQQVINDFSEMIAPMRSGNH